MGKERGKQPEWAEIVGRDAHTGWKMKDGTKGWMAFVEWNGRKNSKRKTGMCRSLEVRTNKACEEAIDGSIYTLIYE